MKQTGKLGLTQSGEGEDKETQCQGMAVISWPQACDVSTQPPLKDLMRKHFDGGGQRDATTAESTSSPVASLPAGVPQVNIDWPLRFFPPCGDWRTVH